MKKVLLVLFIIITLSPFTISQEWVTVNEPLTQSSFLDLFFIDELKGWACGAGGVIFHTNDAGVNWQLQNTGTTKDITKIFFIDENNGWAGTGNNLLATRGGSVLRTTDGGASWEEIDYTYINTSIGFTYCDGLQFTDINNGFMLAGQAKSLYLLRSTDSGLTWEKKDSLISTSSTFPRWYDLDFNGQKGVVVGNRKEIQRYTTDGGETWLASAPIVDGFFKDLRAVNWINETDIITLGEGNEFNGVLLPIYRSTDAGQTWVKKTIQNPKTYERVRDMYFANSMEGIAVGSNGFALAFIYKTSDGGESWTASAAPFGFSLRTVTGKGHTIFALGTGNHIIKSTDLGDTWELLNIKPTSGIYNISFINGKGFALTRNGGIYKNEDGTGEDWSQISSTGIWEAASMFFQDENTGFVHKENRYILKTVDGGQTWTTVLEPVPFNARNKVGGIYFPDQSTGYAWMSINQYSEYYVYKSTDGGDSWTETAALSGTGSTLSGDMKFFDQNSGFLAGTGGWLKYTSDGGTTWNDPTINNIPAGYATKDYEKAALINETTAWVAGYGKLLKTIDKGATWEYVNHNIELNDSSFYTLSFLDDNTGYIGTFNGLILKTTDGGLTWNTDETFYDQHLFYSSDFNADGEIFFGSLNGYIVKYRNEPVGIKDVTNSPVSFSLSQNYPNPFNPTTVIRFSIEQTSNVELKVFDMLGREVALLINARLEAGEHVVNFNAANLTSGIYVYKISAGQYSSSRKMLLLK